MLRIIILTQNLHKIVFFVPNIANVDKFFTSSTNVYPALKVMVVVAVFLPAPSLGTTLLT